MLFKRLIVLTGFLIATAYPAAAEDFAGGDGSEENPWQISEPEHLDNIRNHMGDHFELIDDIDLTGTPYSEGSGWDPVGSCDYNVNDQCSGNAFTGLLDGNNHTITGLFIDRETEEIGLFGAIEDGAVIVDLNLEDVDVTTKENYAGALAAVVFNSEVFAVTVTGKVTGASFTGGVVGSLYEGTLQQVHADVEVDGQDNAGGVVGAVNDGWETNTAYIKGCSASGNVTGRMSAGGLIGHIFNDGEVTDSHATGDVIGTSQQAGGLMGALTEGSLLERSYATGNVTVEFNIAAGLVGWVSRNAEVRDSYATGRVETGEVLGGLVATNEGTVTRSYSVGSIKATDDDPSDVGGLIGRDTGTVTASFWDTITSGTDESDGGTGHPSSVLKEKSTFEDADWEFGNGEDPVWTIRDGSDDYISYPYLYPIYFDNEQDPPPGLEPAPSDEPFVTIWQTDKPGESDDDQIIIPGEGTDYQIAWEEVGNPDNSGSESGTDEHTVTFPEPGTYRVEITGDFHRFHFNRYSDPAIPAGSCERDEGDYCKLIEVAQWGGIVWSAMNGAFVLAENMDVTAEDEPDLREAGNTNFMFYKARSMDGDIGHWDISGLDSLHGMFWGAESFNQDISDWETGNVVNMNRMFWGAESFNQDIGGWDTENVEQMHRMFKDAESFNQDLQDWDLSSVWTMSRMFEGAAAFNGNVKGWDTGHIENMGRMFKDAESFDQDLSLWDITSVVDMTEMFNDSGLSTENYDNILAAWADQEAEQDIFFGAEGITYCNAGESRDRLIEVYGWQIDDGGLADGCPDTGVPAKVLLAEPAHEEATDEDSLTFSWYASEDPPADAYGFELAGDDSFDEMVVDSVTADTAITLGGLEWDSNYYWRVRAENEAGWGEYSEIRNIDILTTITEPVADVPDEFGLDQNYPNPFNPATEIGFRLPEASDVRLEIFDSLGRRVTTLVDNQMPAGTHQVTFDAGNLSSGVYIYRIRAGEFTETRSMMFVK